MLRFVVVLVAGLIFLRPSARIPWEKRQIPGAADCKVTPLDPQWPSESGWSALNSSIDGVLIKTAPIASSCWPGNPFNSPDSCDEVQAGWNSSNFHAALPESIDTPIFANNSCLPPGFPGYFLDRGCTVGGLPQYVVNATTEQQIATAMKWASERHVRIIIKGTGHDLLGRSSGAWSLSIWTHNFRTLDFDSAWPLPTGNGTADALIVGSGIRWREVYAAAEEAGRAVVGGGDGSVGLGGHIQGGGHGPLSSTYGLAADNVFQATIITTAGEILCANEVSHPDLLWAIRGGTGGLYGVVTEFVLQTHPAVSNVTLGTLSITASDASDAAVDATWDAAARLTAALPDLMDAGLTGTVYLGTGLAALSLAPQLSSPPPGVLVLYRPYAFNTTAAAMTALLAPILNEDNNDNSTAAANLTTTTYIPPTTFPNFNSFFTAFGQSTPAGMAGLTSSRLLPRASLTAPDTPPAQLRARLAAVLAPQSPAIGAVLVLTMTAGARGPARVPERMRGALNPAWRSAYLHAVAATSVLDTGDASKTPGEVLREGAAWLDANTERSWREWCPQCGAYFNEANGFARGGRELFYGESYEGLAQVKARVDPRGAMWVLGGVESEPWGYDWESGRLCKREG